MKRLALVIGMLCTVCLQTEAQYVSEVCVADQGNGTYRNPVLHADYSDPDVCAVGDDFYMTASSFGCTPGLPVLHSKDLVNWEYKGTAFTDATRPTWGGDHHIWAPEIRYFNNHYVLYL